MGGGTGEEPKKVQGSHAGIYVFDSIDVPEPKYPVVHFKNTVDNSFGSEYEMDVDVYIELGRPDKIKVHDLVEAIE